MRSPVSNAFTSLVAVLLGTGGAASAEPDRVSLLFGSHHLDAVEDFETFNPGIFLTWSPITAGVYRNSYGDLSASLTYDLPIWQNGETIVSVFGGVSWYGEQSKTFAIDLGGGLVPVGGIQVIHDHLFVQLIPSDGVVTDAVLTVGVTW